MKKLIKGFKKANGRNNQGKITSRYKGGGHKQKYRAVSFNRKNIKGTIESIEYDPNRSSKLALINNNFNYNYIILPDNLTVGDFIESGENVPIKIGNSLPLYKLPLGSIIHNVDAKYTRSAGSFSQLLQKDKYIKIRLSSGQQKLIPTNSYATLGVVSNIKYKNYKNQKAGRSRWLNKRPKVRGVAKNPIDHPHGGGEGKTGGGRPSVSFTGRITKGKPTVKKKLIIK